MNRKEFIDGLRDGLSGMPEHEMEERISFYNEMIDEHMANGESEETAIAAIGSVDAAVAQISSEIPLAKLVRDRVRLSGVVPACAGCSFDHVHGLSCDMGHYSCVFYSGSCTCYCGSRNAAGGSNISDVFKCSGRCVRYRRRTYLCRTCRVDLPGQRCHGRLAVKTDRKCTSINKKGSHRKR